MAEANSKISPSTSGTQAVESKDADQTERKPTVLETHGYALGKTIGSGSYATVKIAQSNRHENHVAVKIVSKFQAPPAYLKKFLPREIEVVKGLRHPNLIRFFQAIETTHRVYIIMEYAQNGSLLDIIRRDSYIDEERSRKWFRELLIAVEYCHDRGVVHRDIKCENLLLDQYLNLKISDFGFARGHMKPKNGVSILSETFCGSFAYASPEILRGIPYQPQLSDIWSLGVVLYAMVYGRLPFDDTTYAQLLKVPRYINYIDLHVKTEVYNFSFNILMRKPILQFEFPYIFQQVQSKVTFLKVPRVSYPCRALISRILVPQRSRARIEDIKEDQWLTVPMVSVHTSVSKQLAVLNAPKLTGSDAEVMLAEQMTNFDDKVHQG